MRHSSLLSQWFKKQVNPLKRWCLLLPIILMTACASRPPAQVDEINTRQYKSSTQNSRNQVRKPDQYRVKKGDSLYSIGFRYQIDYKQLAAINNINPPYVIYPNQRLRLKPFAQTSSKKQQTTKPKTSSIITQPQSQTKTPPKAKSTNRPTEQTKPASKPTTKNVTVTTSQKPRQKMPQAVVNLPKNSDLNWLWPTQGKIRTTFSGSNPARKGISIRGQEGQDVKAAEAGVVVYSGDGLLGYGELIIIKHNDSYLSAYGHNKKRLVKEGQQIKRGEVIALLGSSGTNVDNLHFEIRKNGRPVNPLDYVKP